MTDPHTNRSRGFGFVTYDGSSSVEECLKEKSHVLGMCVYDSAFFTFYSLTMSVTTRAAACVHVCKCVYNIHRADSRHCL